MCHVTHRCMYVCTVPAQAEFKYGVATISRMLKNICLFAEYRSLLWGSFALETYVFKHPTHRSHPISVTHLYDSERMYIYCVRDMLHVHILCVLYVRICKYMYVYVNILYCRHNMCTCTLYHTGTHLCYIVCTLRIFTYM